MAAEFLLPNLHDSFLIPAVVLAALAACLGFSLILKRVTGATWSGRLPPGPRAWPVIGNLHLLGAMPHQSLANLALRYGPLMSMRLGSIRLVVASTPEMAKQFLQVHDSTFASRPSTAANSHLFFSSTNLSSAPYGPYWRLIRRVCLNQVFQPKRLASFMPIRLQEVHGLICGLHRTCGQPTILRPRLQEAANNIISRMTLGRTFKDLSFTGSVGDIVGIIDEVFFLLGVPNVGDFIPWLARMDLQGLERRMRAVKERVRLVLGEIINNRRAERSANAAGLMSSAHPDRVEDLLDVLLAAASTEQTDSGSLITDDNIMAVILDMYLGGTDTTAITTEWALAELLANPACLKQVQEELDQVVGRERLVDDSDMEKLPYLRAVVQETFRLHPALPLLLPHLAMKACSVAGYDLPANTLVYVNVWAIGRDPDTWEEPLAFQPERFVGSDVQEKGQHFQLLPFGAGRRSCVGWELGLIDVRLFLARLLQSFEWTLLVGAGNVDMREHFGLKVMMANALTVHASPRLPSNFYNETD